MMDQKLVDELEKALTDEAYDGGMGALSGEEFSELVRTLAVTAAEVVEKAHTPTDDEREALADLLGEPVRGTLALADRILAAGFRRTEVPEPSAEEFRQQIADERARQIDDGYDILHDRAHGVDHLLTWAQDYARRGRSVQTAALIEAAREMLREGAK